MKNFYIVLIFLIWCWLSYSLIKYFRTINKFESLQLLQINQFVYLLTFWQALSFLFAASILLPIFPWLIIILVGLLVFLLIGEIIQHDVLKKSSKLLVVFGLTLTTIEIFAVVQLLPLHYYAQAALVTSWFYFIVELTLQGQDLTSRRKIFWRYLIFFVIVGIVLLVSDYLF